MNRAEILIGVSYNPETEVAGLAVTFRGGRVICLEAVHAEDHLSAHLQAAIRCAEITSSPRSHSAAVFTDSDLIVPCLAKEVEPIGREARELLRVLGGQMEALGPKLTIERVAPERVRNAFIAARQTRKVFMAGERGVGTWWSRSEPSAASKAVAA